VSDIRNGELPLDPIFQRRLTFIHPMVTSRRQIQRIGQRQERTEAVVSNLVAELVHRGHPALGNPKGYLLSMT